MRVVATAVVSLLANTIALVVAAAVLEQVTVHADGFVVAVLVFTVVSVVVEPLIHRVAEKNVPAILGGSALIATLISLVVAALVGDGLAISGLTTWVMATVVVWLVGLVLRLLLPLFVFKQVLRRPVEIEEGPS